jgi:hypothetical protein
MNPVTRQYSTTRATICTRSHVSMARSMMTVTRLLCDPSLIQNTLKYRTRDNLRIISHWFSVQNVRQRVPTFLCVRHYGGGGGVNRIIVLKKHKYPKKMPFFNFCISHLCILSSIYVRSANERGEWRSSGNSSKSYALRSDWVSFPLRANPIARLLNVPSPDRLSCA